MDCICICCKVLFVHHYFTKKENNKNVQSNEERQTADPKASESHWFWVNEDAPHTPTLGQSPVKRSRGEWGYKIAPLPTARNRNKEQGGECQWDRYRWFTGCKYVA